MGTDPFLGAVAAKAGSEIASSTTSLIQRALGPAADVLGEHLAAMTRKRVANTERIAAKTIEKADRFGRTGSANPRVAKAVLEEGSYCDDDLMSEYFSGLLASSWTPDGRDDRAVFWSKLVAGLSSPQVRLHYLLYREWAARLHGRYDITLGLDDGRRKAEAEILLIEILSRMTPEGEEDLTVSQPDQGYSVLSHAIVGLVREGVLADKWGVGNKSGLKRENSPYPQLLHAMPSAAGIELFGWAIGQRGLSAYEFLNLGDLPPLEPPIPRLVNFTMPSLPDPPTVGEDSPAL